MAFFYNDNSIFFLMNYQRNRLAIAIFDSVGLFCNKDNDEQLICKLENFHCLNQQI